jgi:hypothetical protein
MGMADEEVKTFFKSGSGDGIAWFDNIQALAPSATHDSHYETGTNIFFKNGIWITLNTSKADAERLTKEFSLYLEWKSKIAGLESLAKRIGLFPYC